MHVPIVSRTICVVTLWFIAACSSTEIQVPHSETPAPATRTEPASKSPAVSWEDSVLLSLSLEEKVGQMIMVVVPTAYTSDDSREFRKALSLVHDWNVGAVAFSKGDVYGAATMVNRLQRVAKVPILVAADLEHGLAMRLLKGTELPDAMAFGAANDAGLARRAGRLTAEEARAVGIRLLLAPVVDVNTNPGNPAINTRSFGERPVDVARLGAAFVRGAHDEGILTAVKHFPGHGGTSEDSHLEMPIVRGSRTALDSTEFLPFRTAIAAGTDVVMIGHMAVPSIDPSRLPASLSPAMVSGLVREELRFSGVIMTDAMGMAGARVLPPGRAAVQAVKAGEDMLILTNDEVTAIQAIRDAFRSGVLPESRLNESVRRILALKRRAGLDVRRFVDIDAIPSAVGTRSHWEEARVMADRAVTVVRNDHSTLPIRTTKRHRVLTILLSDSEDPRHEIHRPGPAAPDERTGTYFLKELARHGIHTTVERLTLGSSKAEFASVESDLKSADRAIVVMHVKVRTSTGHIGIPEHFSRFIRDANAGSVPLTVVAFGDPYTAAAWPNARAVVCAYSDADVMQEAVAAVLAGDQTADARLPVSVSARFPAGSGISTGTPPRVQPESLAVAPPSSRWSTVDSLVESAIRDSAFPGGQLVVVKGDTIVHRRCFGRQTYDPSSAAIDWSTLYDLASLTKVVATTPSMMKLFDQGLVGLDDSVSEYLGAFKAGLKRQITIRELLLHRSGFPPFRKLWETATTPSEALDSALATPLVAPPGDTTIYSDIGMITTGQVIQSVSGMRLDAFADAEIFGPLGMKRTMFNPPSTLKSSVAPTEYDSVWRKTQIQGTVHDENAWLLGGVSGHAGLFSCADDLARYASMMLSMGRFKQRTIFSRSTYRDFVGTKADDQSRWLGWDMKSAKGSSAGTLLSSSSFGHTGFTGTSIWIDPERMLAVIFLTNRVYPTRANTKLIHFRPVLHDAVARTVDEIR
jgi:beta-glucosidase-like glycosyl hydrolase/CubicO group peptidase (beta-lactamase class C family)